MGVIQRQVFKSNLLSYVGIAIGALTNVFLFPKDPGLKGYVDTLLKSALLLAPVLMLGTTTVMIHFSPYVKGGFKRANAKLLARMIVVGGGSLLALALVNFFFRDTVFELLLARGISVEKLQTSSWIVIGLLVAIMGTNIVNTALSIYQRIAVPVLFNNIFLKVALPVIFLLALYGYLERSAFAWALVGIYLLSLLGVVAYGMRIGALNLEWGKLEVEGRSAREMYTVAGFSIIGTLGSVLAVYIDTLTVNFYLGDVPTGYYGFAAFAVSLIMVPHKAMTSIANPIITREFKDGNVNALAALYRDSARTLLVMGSFILAGLVVCLPTLYQVTPKMQQFAVGYSATIVLGLGVLTDQMTSINGQLISFSRYFRMGTIFVLIMGVINVALNYVFIGRLGYGLLGAGMATAISLLIYNALKSVFVYLKFRMHPFSTGMVFTLAVSAFAVLTGRLLPDVGIVLVDLLIKGGWVTGCFAGYVLGTNYAPVLKSAILGKIAGAINHLPRK